MTSNKTIVQHISEFLDYCGVEKGLRNNTQKNYKEYLNKLFGWLKLRNLDALLPHQLTPEHIWEYRLYLSQHENARTGKSLKIAAQNYYLIALRAPLSYFLAKDILSLPPSRVALPRPNKTLKNTKIFSQDQIKALLSAPKGSSPIALRDRVILHIIISTI